MCLQGYGGWKRRRNRRWRLGVAEGFGAMFFWDDQLSFFEFSNVNGRMREGKRRKIRIDQQ
jgi:hypothetical protein